MGVKTGVAGSKPTVYSEEPDWKHSNMWTAYLEILVFLNFVTPTVIPDDRKITERADTQEKNEEENSIPLTRMKRDAYFDNILNEPIVLEDTRIWNREVCEKITRRSLLSSSVDDRGSRILVLGPRYSASSTYQHYIDTHRCVHPGQVVMVGGVNVKCVQQYLKETLVVANVAGQEIFKRPIFLPSGCQAMVER